MDAHPAFCARMRAKTPDGMTIVPGNEVRLATTVGQPHLRPLGGGRYVMPDGTTRFLVDHERLLNVTKGLGGSLLDPLKSTVVHEQRSMGTWVVRKRER